MKGEYMINIDFLMAGCNTHCRHCYVNGGPGPLMPVEDALLCIEKLDGLAAYLTEEVTFTLDHEPMNHPQIHRILRGASRTKHIQHYHHGMTTGVGLMHRADKDAVVKAYLDCGYDAFGITIHGNAAHHDEIVRRKGAYAGAVAAAEFLKAHGAKIEVSLMLNRYFAEDAESVTEMLCRLQPDYVGFAMPIFTPHRNMMAFEPYRATVDTVALLREWLPQWRQDEGEILKEAEQNTVAAVVRRLKQGVDLEGLFARKQEELYLTLHQDCKLYVGNSGGETSCLGDLRELDLKETAGIISALPGNRDYGAYYDAGSLPTTDALVQALEGIPQNLVYGDFESVLYRGFVELGVPTRILK